jgi:hypothetical protein
MSTLSRVVAQEDLAGQTGYFFFCLNSSAASLRSASTDIYWCPGDTNGQMKKPLISDKTGQDGSYLVEYPLSKGCEVHGITRKASTFKTSRIDHICQDFQKAGARRFACRESVMVPHKDGVRGWAEGND